MVVRFDFHEYSTAFFILNFFAFLEEINKHDVFRWRSIRTVC